MSKSRMVNTKFWNDSWIRKINPLDRYLFLYFLTNEHTNICGIYELPLETIAYETGLDERELEKSMLPKLHPKIIYVNGWVGITNFIKNQNQKSPKVILGIENELKAIPKDIIDKMIEYGYPIDTLSYLIKSNLIKSNLIKYSTKGADIIKLFESIDPKNKNYYGNVTQRKACDFLLKEYGEENIISIVNFIKDNRLKKYFPSITSPYELQEKWTKIGEFGFKNVSNDKSRGFI
jgi:hypothetical protein